MAFGSDLELVATLAVAMAAFGARIEMVHCCKFDIGFEKGGLGREVSDGFANTTIDDEPLFVGHQASDGYWAWAGFYRTFCASLLTALLYS